MMKFKLIAIVLLAFLIGCSRTDPQVTKIACPEIFILKDVDRVARFLPDGKKPSINNLVYEARSTFGDGSCKFEGGKLSLKLLVGAYVKTAPLFEDEISSELNQELEMYIGVRNKEGEIIGRQSVGLDLQSGKKGKIGEEKKGTPLLRAFFSDKAKFDALFPKNLLQVQSSVNLNILPLPTEQPSDYSIYIGFRITESELEFNRSGYLPSF